MKAFHLLQLLLFAWSLSMISAAPQFLSPEQTTVFTTPPRIRITPDTFAASSPTIVYKGEPIDVNPLFGASQAFPGGFPQLFGDSLARFPQQFPSAISPQGVISPGLDSGSVTTLAPILHTALTPTLAERPLTQNYFRPEQGSPPVITPTLTQALFTTIVPAVSQKSLLKSLFQPRNTAAFNPTTAASILQDTILPTNAPGALLQTPLQPVDTASLITPTVAPDILSTTTPALTPRPLLQKRLRPRPTPTLITPTLVDSTITPFSTPLPSLRPDIRPQPNPTLVSPTFAPLALRETFPAGLTPFSLPNFQPQTTAAVVEPAFFPGFSTTVAPTLAPRLIPESFLGLQPQLTGGIVSPTIAPTVAPDVAPTLRATLSPAITPRPIINSRAADITSPTVSPIVQTTNPLSSTLNPLSLGFNQLSLTPSPFRYGLGSLGNNGLDLTGVTPRTLADLSTSNVVRFSSPSYSYNYPLHA